MISTFSSIFYFLRVNKISPQTGKVLMLFCALVLMHNRIHLSNSIKTASSFLATLSQEDEMKIILEKTKKLSKGERRQLDVMARTIYGEARGEKSNEALEAIATVILNRANDDKGRWPTCVIAVSKQKQQFSCWNANDPNVSLIQKVTLEDKDFRRCYKAAFIALEQYKKQQNILLQGANHYHTVNVDPTWSKHTQMIRVAQIGRHVFYRA